MAALVVLGNPGTASADGGLTEAVTAAYFPRNVDATLHEIAHQRVGELMACQCLEHGRMRPGTAEVLAWNVRLANPLASVVQQWAASAPHHGILSNTSYGRIGCAEAVGGATHWFACVLAGGPLPVGTAAGAGTDAGRGGPARYRAGATGAGRGSIPRGADADLKPGLAA
jgi:hypothetical protein